MPTHLRNVSSLSNTKKHHTSTQFGSHIHSWNHPPNSNPTRRNYRVMTSHLMNLRAIRMSQSRFCQCIITQMVLGSTAWSSGKTESIKNLHGNLSPLCREVRRKFGIIIWHCRGLNTLPCTTFNTGFNWCRGSHLNHRNNSRLKPMLLYTLTRELAFNGYCRRGGRAGTLSSLMRWV